MSIAIALCSGNNMVLAADTQLTRVETSPQGAMKIKVDGYQKLDIIQDIGVASISVMSGFESRIIDSVKYKIANGREKLSYREILELFITELNNDWEYYKPNEKVPEQYNYILEYVFVGNNELEIPSINRVICNRNDKKLVVVPHKYSGYVTGLATSIGWYLLKTTNAHKLLKNQDIKTLKKLATLIITESSMYESINNDVSIVEISGNRACFVSDDEINVLKEEVTKARVMSSELLFEKLRS